MTHEQLPSPDESEDLGARLGLTESGPRRHAAKGSRRRAGGGCFLLAVLIAAMLAALAFGGYQGLQWARDQFGSPADYPGPGTTPVLVEVAPGDTADQIGVSLEEAGVVQTSEAFVVHARNHADAAAGIQAGWYELKKQSSAEEAFLLLTDPKNIRTEGVTIPEGMRVVDVIDILVKKTGHTKGEFLKALAKPKELGLPAYAEGDAEGYLFPATYAFAPKAKPSQMLRQMVTRWRQAADEVGLEAAATRLGYTPHELMTVASLVEAEGRGDDMPKIARVIYNRLTGPGDRQGTYGKLQLDATVNYAHGDGLGASTSSEERQIDSPYNTYRYEGLPPGPIEAPGQDAMEAAANPATGDWYYYVTVNLQTGETKFAKTYAEHQRNVAEWEEYCRTQSASGCR